MENVGNELKSGVPGKLDPDLRAKLIANIPVMPAADPALPRGKWNLPQWSSLSRRRRLELWAGGAIVIVLYALLVPTFNRARESAGRSADQSDMGRSVAATSSLKNGKGFWLRSKSSASTPETKLPRHRGAAEIVSSNGSTVNAPVSITGSDTLSGSTPADAPNNYAANTQGATNRLNYNLSGATASRESPLVAGSNTGSFQTGSGGMGMPSSVSNLPPNVSQSMPKMEKKSANALSASEQLDPLSLTERKVHKTADITVEVQKVEAQSEAVAALITSAGGYVAQNELTTGDDNAKTASLTTKVPVGQFENVVAQIARIGIVKAKSVTGEDVTEKMSDEQEAEHVLQNDINETRNKLNGRESRGQRAEDAKTLRELRIRNAQSAARLTLLKRLSVMADITVQLTDKPANIVEPPKKVGFWNDMSDTAQDAAHSFVQAMKLPILLLVWLLVYAPVWMLLMLGYRYAVRR